MKDEKKALGGRATGAGVDPCSTRQQILDLGVDEHADFEISRLDYIRSLAYRLAVTHSRRFMCNTEGLDVVRVTRTM